MIREGVEYKLEAESIGGARGRGAEEGKEEEGLWERVPVIVASTGQVLRVVRVMCNLLFTNISK